MIKIGLHILPGPHTAGLLDMIGRLAKAGHPVPGVTVVNDPVLANAIKQKSPRTFVVYRYEDNSNPGEDTPGSMWFDHRWGFLQLADQADAYQFDNEWRPATVQRLVDYNMGLFDACNPHGIKAVFGNMGVGQIEPADIPTLIPLLKRAKAEGHIPDYHAYDSKLLPQGDQDMSFQAQWYDMRWVDWDSQVPGLPIVFGECGNYDANFLGDDQTLKLMQQFNDMLQPYPQAMFGSWWTFGGQDQGWGRSSDDSILAKYEAWLMGGTTTEVSTIEPKGMSDLIVAASKLGDDLPVTVTLQDIEYMITLGEERPALTAAPQPPTDHLVTMQVTTTGGVHLRVRAAPSPTGTVQGDGLAPDTVVTAVQGSTVKASDGSQWIMIVRPQQGWVSSTWVKTVA